MEPVGVKASQTLYDDEFITISWNALPQSIELSAKRNSSLTSENYRALLEKLLLLMGQQGAKKLLADLENLEKIDMNDLLWSETSWFPRALKAGVSVFAMVMPKSLSAHMSVDKSAENVVKNPAGGFTRGVFSNAQEARRWLARQ